MPINQRLEALPDPRYFHIASQLQCNRHVVGQACLVHLRYQIGSFLGGGHGIAASLLCFRNRDIGLTASQAGCKALWRRVAEHLFQCKTGSRLFFDLVHQSGGSQRMTAQFKEVIFEANFFYAEDICKGRTDCFLFRVPRRHIFPFALALDLRQGTLIQLAVSRHGNLLDLCHIGRDHILRQALRQLIPDTAYADFFIADNVRINRFLAVGVCTGNHSAVLDILDCTDAALDLTQFNTEATDFHLFVNSAQVFNVPIR